MANTEMDFDQIKKMILASLRGPVNFGLCLANKPEDCAIELDRKKPPETLMRSAKKLGRGNKFACGTMTAKGKKLSFLCETNPPPGAAKPLRLFLQDGTGVTYKIAFLDPAGNLLESDGEDEDKEEEVAADAAPADDDPGVVDEASVAAPAAPPISEEAPSPELTKWRQVEAALAPKVEVALAGNMPGAAKIRALWDFATTKAGTGNPAAALQAASKMIPLLKASAAPAAPGAEEKAPPELAKWRKAEALLAPKVEAALKANTPDASRIRAVWAFAQEKAEAGDETTALKAVERLVPLLKAAASAAARPVDGAPTESPASQAAKPEPVPDAVPQNVVALQRSRILWINAKREMKAGLLTFRSAVMSDAEDEEDKDEILAAADLFVNSIDEFDAQLEDQLDALSQQSDGPERTKMKKAAEQTIARYLKVLEGPFFSEIDANPFVPVKVTSTGRQALMTISAALS